MSGKPVTPLAGGEVSDESVRALVRRHAPSHWRERDLALDLRLDHRGVGFDSVGLLELVVACERELRLRVPPDIFLDDQLTVGGLIAKLRDATAAL